MHVLIEYFNFFLSLSSCAWQPTYLQVATTSDKKSVQLIPNQEDFLIHPHFPPSQKRHIPFAGYWVLFLMFKICLPTYSKAYLIFFTSILFLIWNHATYIYVIRLNKLLILLLDLSQFWQWSQGKGFWFTLLNINGWTHNNRLALF